VEAALFEAVGRGISLVRAVDERYPELLVLLDRALDRVDAPMLHSVRPHAELIARLPAGMCERLLALPVRRDSRSESVDVASVDVLDAHVASEFAFQLGVPVRILRAPLQAIALALKGLREPAAEALLEAERPYFGNRAALPTGGAAPVGRSERLSERPLPLIKKSLAPNPPWTTDAPAVSFIEPARLESDDPALEPVLSLGRSKPFAGPGAELGGPPWTLEFEAAVATLDSASSPEQVVSGLCEGLGPVPALVFAVRGSSFDVRGGSAALGPAALLRTISVPSGNGNLLDAATRLGFYFGPLAQLLSLVSLQGKWGVPPGSDCYARSVNVSERASLIVLMAGFSESTEATRRADVLAQSASSALERIVRSRKRG
jgi:hypothetical protein